MAMLFSRRLSAALSHISRSAPFLTYYCIKYVFARVGRALFQVRFFQVPTLMPFPIMVHKVILRRGNIHPSFFRNSRLKFRHGGKSTFSTGESYHTTVCRTTQIRQRTCDNPVVLRDDWNPSQSESSCPLLKPWLLHT